MAEKRMKINYFMTLKKSKEFKCQCHEKQLIQLCLPSS